ncbi:hypothetical protein CPB85DRAFT_1337148 [Mucidula mucida]|nr:hypothetical protein CPB85DRAFT_1337148 [Mucidula mucida]
MSDFGMRVPPKISRQMDPFQIFPGCLSHRTARPPAGRVSAEPTATSWERSIVADTMSDTQLTPG